MKTKKSGTVYLVASGDLRLSANQVCWPAQETMEKLLITAVEAKGFKVVRAHTYDKAKKHGFIDSQALGMCIFQRIPKNAPLIVAEAVWQYSHHVLAGLTAHCGPILTVANWSGQWPGLVGMLNLNGSLTKAGVNYSTLWSEDFTDDYFLGRLENWLKKGRCTHDTSHALAYSRLTPPLQQKVLGQQLARDFRRRQAIMGIFDEGCMGMFNAIIPEELLHPTGVFKERLSQSALFAEMTKVECEEARLVYEWLLAKGMRFHTGTDDATELTEDQILKQCAMYIAAVRIADDFGCACIGIQYQQGLKDLCPASDLVEGMLNNSDRPPVRSRDGQRILFEGQPVIHFNEVDECAGLDALITNWVQTALGQPVETTLHDLRWGDLDRSGAQTGFVWVFEISGAVPPAHFANGWADAEGFRQPAMYFPKGGSTLRGISKPGHIVWSRIYVADGRLNADIGLGKVVSLLPGETERRWQATTPQWPIMHAITPGITRDQMMAQHKANHLNVVYCTDQQAAVRSLWTKAAMMNALGIRVNICGTVPKSQ